MAGSLPQMMRKIVVCQLGSNFSQVTKLVEAPVPKPGPDEVLVRNRYVGINASDVNFTAGRYQPELQPPFDAGFEGLGQVVATGENAPFKVGQPVVYLNYGAFAEYKAVEAKRVVPLPEEDPQFLPFMLSGLTAAISLDKVAEIKKGDKVLVTAAAGGTGQFAVQWCKNAGCEVIGTCSTDDKVQFLKSIGCDRPINYKKEDLDAVLKAEYPNALNQLCHAYYRFTLVIQTYTELKIATLAGSALYPCNLKDGVNVVYESVGGAVFETCLNNLAVNGRLMVIGAISGYLTDYSGFKSTAMLPLTMLKLSASLRGFFLIHYSKDFKEFMMKLIQLYKQGKITSTVDMGEKSAGGAFLGLDRVNDAVEYMFTSQNIGKIAVQLFK